MPTAKLLKPASLNTLGRIWKKGVVEPVDNHTARLLSRNPRFKVEGLDKTIANAAEDLTLPEDAPTKPKGRTSLGKAIREVVDDVDADNEANFGSNGAPTAAAISALLGYDVTDEEVVLALNPNAKGQATQQPISDAAEVAAAAGNSRASRVKITRTAKDETAAADAADAGAPTTEPAVEV